MVSVVIHSSPTLANQVESAQWLRTGFLAHGIDAEITADKHKEADVHVIQGPWYAFDEWLKKSADHRVLWLNRCFYGHPRFDVSLGWLRPDGSRDFKNLGMAAPSNPPLLRTRKCKRRCAVVFGDYGRDATQDVARARWKYDSVFFRPHPAQNQETPVMTLKGGLQVVWDFGDVAIGHSSTVLVEAEINGLHVISSDPLHVCHGVGDSEEDREQWAVDLSWAQWGHEELKRGEFWEHLC